MGSQRVRHNWVTFTSLPNMRLYDCDRIISFIILQYFQGALMLQHVSVLHSLRLNNIPLCEYILVFPQDLARLDAKVWPSYRARDLNWPGLLRSEPSTSTEMSPGLWCFSWHNQGGLWQTMSSATLMILHAQCGSKGGHVSQKSDFRGRVWEHFSWCKGMIHGCLL